MTGEVVRPEWDAWVGVPGTIRRYATELEAEVGRLRAGHELDVQIRDRELARLQAELVRTQRRVRALEQQLALAEERLRLTSQNSSKPPSSDPPTRPKPTARPATGRRRGGQPGHPFHPRPLVPVEHVTTVVDHRPTQCARCSAALDGSDPAPLRHQILEIPVPRPLVVEHRLHSLRCACGHVTRACLPKGVTGNGFGPGVEGTVAVLASGCRLSHRMIVTVLRDLFGVRMGLGTVARLLERAARAVEEPVEQARRRVRWDEGVKCVDETGWFQRGADGTNEDGRRAWLWAVTTEAVTYYEIALSRGQGVARRLLGEVAVGTVVSDRYAAYGYIDVERRQVCWAHLYRDFVRISERRGEAGRLGRALTKLAETLFALWHGYRAGRVEAGTWASETTRLRWRMRKLLERGASAPTRRDERSARSRTKHTCAELLGVEPAMWRFVDEPEVGLTNNAAERALRHAVLLRRVSYGSQSQEGARAMARLLTAVMTLRARGQSAHRYLVEACRARHEGRAAPSLLGTEARELAPVPPTA